MPREPKPYYRKKQKRWVCTIHGVRITLGENKKEAMAEFRRLMLNRTSVVASMVSKLLHHVHASLVALNCS